MNPIASIFQCRSRPLQPIPTGQPVQWASQSNVRAVLFDVYGTIVISGSGDVGTVAEEGQASAWSAALAEMELDCDIAAGDGVKRLRQTIQKQHQAARASGIDYPEIDIVEIWQATLEEIGAACPAANRTHLLWWQRLAAEYEARANPTWPMPGLEDCLARLRKEGIELGIISNAQFFTPELFPALLSKSLPQLGFAPQLQFYSYRAGHAKPGRELYDDAARTLRRVGISPRQAVYVGNDMLNDMLPAGAVGFRTALFAGDRRSLRLRADDPRVEGVCPDMVVNDLSELADCIVGPESSAPNRPVDAGP